MNDLILIFAGSHNQYSDYCRKRQIPMERSRFVHSRENIIGMRNQTLICTGTWFTDLNSIDIVETAKAQEFKITYDAKPSF